MDLTIASNGIQVILAKLEDSELFNLASTVTQGLLRNKLETREGAIEAIFSYSSDLLSILRRKVVTREILFSYLHDNKVPVKLPATKHELVDLIAKHWNLEIVSPANNCFTSETAKHDVNAMALQFSQWFYTMLNGNEPIGREHFWTDSLLVLNLINGEQTITECIENDVDNLVQKLFHTKVNHNLYFNPNLMSEGLQGQIDPHGLVAVLVCGTLHNNNMCVGVFEQKFMLARDPLAENNWKIKKLELILKSKSDVDALPTLCDSKLLHKILALPSR